MGIQKIILNFILKIESFFVSMLSINKKRITFVSLEDEILASDFKLIYDQLDKNEFDIKLCLIRYQKNLWGQFLYFLNCMKQLYLINTSKIVILHDNNYVVSHYKRRDVTVLQVWHACGAVKKFGNVIERQYKIANYDYVLATSSYWKKSYSQAFDVLEEHVLPIGMPRTDELFDSMWLDEKREKLFKKYPKLVNKKIILYAPTFRGNIYKGFTSIDFDVKRILDELGDDYVLIYKFHPLIGNYILSDDSRVFNMNHEDTHELFSISDYLISDYSSIVFDYMILEKPLLFFVPDLKEYTQDLGVFVDIYDLHSPVCKDEKEIISYIQKNSFEYEYIKELKNTFFSFQDGKCTKRVVEFLRGIINEENN